MRPRDTSRDNLVMSMTLAELFLLLLFVVWSSSHLPAKDEKNRPVAVAELQKRIRDLQQTVDQLHKENEDLRLDNDLLKRKFGIDPGVSGPGLPKAADDALLTARRGQPKCAEDNVLSDVVMADGVPRLTLLQSPNEIMALIAPDMRPIIAPRVALTDGPQIAAVLNAVQAFYRVRRTQRQECRFDYRFVYTTDTDYRAGRERFEQVFYPGGGIARANAGR
jgi:hypothetical protein